MNIFVLGTSGVGKTPFASQLADSLGFKHVRAGAWAREAFRGKVFSSRDEENKAMTAYSIEKLKQNPATCIEYLRSHHDLSSCVIEGMRNPFDFTHLFDPRTDTVIFLVSRRSQLAVTTFEEGVEVIRNYVKYLIYNQLLTLGQLHEVEAQKDGGHLVDFNGVVAELAPSIKGWTEASKIQVVTSGYSPPKLVHTEIMAIPSYIQRSFLYDGDERYAQEWDPCRIFAVSSYQGFVPTFKIILDNGSVFSFVPPHAFGLPGDTRPRLDLKDLVYHNCPINEVVVVNFKILSVGVSCYFKNRDLWIDGSYLFTMDWYQGNDLLHAIQLPSGQAAFLPQHKVKFGQSQNHFEPYKKMKTEWKV